MKIKTFFDKNRSNIDIYDLKQGHDDRFLQKLQKKQKSKKGFDYKKYLVAASLLLLFGLFWQYMSFQWQQQQINRELMQNEQYFSNIIKAEMQAVKAEETPETKKVFNDALQQIQILEKDYQKLVNDYKNNPDKYILNAMIQNFQKRIDILQDIKMQIKQIKDSKTYQNEKHRA